MTLNNQSIQKLGRICRQSCSIGVRVVREIDGELAKHLSLPIHGWNVAEALRVDDRHDSHLHASVGQVHAANATIVLSRHAQVILVRELLGVASWLQRSHLEGILLGNLLHLSLLFLLSGNLILDL